MASKTVQKILQWGKEGLAKLPEVGAKIDAALPFAETRKENLASQPTFGGEMGAIFREGINDLRSTLMEIYSGKPESPAGPGTPMSPTQFQINNDLEVQKDKEPDMEM